MKNQALFSSKDISKKLKCHLPLILFGALRVNTLSTKKQTITFTSAELQQKCGQSYIILRIQRLDGK